MCNYVKIQFTAFDQIHAKFQYEGKKSQNAQLSIGVSNI